MLGHCHHLLMSHCIRPEVRNLRRTSPVPREMTVHFDMDCHRIFNTFFLLHLFSSSPREFCYLLLFHISSHLHYFHFSPAGFLHLWKKEFGSVFISSRDNRSIGIVYGAARNDHYSFTSRLSCGERPATRCCGLVW